MNAEPRRYSMARRSLQAEATKKRIREAAQDLYRAEPEHFTLKEVSRRAGTTVQTILRLFESKAALITLLRFVEPAKPAVPGAEMITALRELQDTYEASADTASPSENEHEAHRAWVEQHLVVLGEHPVNPGTQTTLFGLIAATDRATWRLLRQELGLYRRAAEAVVIAMVRGLIGR